MDLTILRLGKAKIQSPLKLSTHTGDKVCNFIPDDDRILCDFSLDAFKALKGGKDASEPLTMERAGPRERLYFDPSKIRVGVVTCGGLCPGINNVIRALVMELHYGFAGLIPE